MQALSDADVDQLVAAEAALYECYLASTHAEQGAGLAGIPESAFADWLEKRGHTYTSHLGSGRPLPVHEEALRFRAYLVSGNDREARCLLAMRNNTFHAWRRKRGHPCKTTGPLPAEAPISTEESDAFLNAYRQARSDAHGGRLLRVPPECFRRQRLERHLPRPSQRIGRRYHAPGSRTRTPGEIAAEDEAVVG